MRNIKNKLYIYKKIARLRVPQKNFSKAYDIINKEKLKIIYINVINFEVDIFLSQENFLSILDNIKTQTNIICHDTDLNMLKLNITNNSKKEEHITQILQKITPSKIVLFNSANLNKIIIIYRSSIEKDIFKNIL